MTHHTANVKRKTQPLRLPSSSLSTFSPPLPSSSSSHSSLFSLAGTPSRFQVLQYSIAYSHAVHQLSKTHSPCITGTLNSLIYIFIPPHSQPLTFYPLLISLTILDFTCESMQCLSFCVCLISLSLSPPGSSTLLQMAVFPFFKKMAGSSYVYIILSLSICSSVGI